MGVLVNPCAPISLGLAISDLAAGGFSVWMQKRAEDGPFRGYWEFPGGKWKVGETPLAACRREFREEAKVDIEDWHPFKIYPVTHADRRLSLHTHLAYRNMDCQWPLEGQEQKWYWIPFAGAIPMKNYGKKYRTVHNLGQIGEKRDRATEACYKHGAGSDGEAEPQDGLKCELLPACGPILQDLKAYLKESIP